MTKVLYPLFFVVTCLICLTKGAPNQPPVGSIAAMSKAKRYLMKFGYTKTFSPAVTEIKAGLKRLQYFANLPLTGKLDTATLKQMDIDRCGLGEPDIQVVKTRRYVHQGSRWRKSDLTWRLVGQGRTLNRDTVRRVMHKAFNFWSQQTNLNFKETAADDPDIWVKFVRYSHADPYPFDGLGGTLAHAFYPHNNQGLSGDIHFDDDEYYTAESPQGRNLLWVATHEIGHSIGMEHSNVREAVMYPWYTKYKPGFKLNYDDIVGIQSLYGSRKKTTARTTTTSTTTTPRSTTTTPRTTIITTTEKKRPVPSNRKCPVTPISAIYYNTYGRLIVLLTKAGKMYFVNRKGGIRYGPINAYNYLPKQRFQQPITAAFDSNYVMGDGRHYTVMFAGARFFIYRHFSFISGPHSIHTSNNPLRLKLPTYVKRIDAAFTWHRNLRTYFFYNGYYWRYDNARKAIDQGYPRKVQDAWRGMPKRIDAAFSTRDTKKTFFVSGNQYYMLNDNYVRLKKGYPEHIGREWLNCGGRSAMNVIGTLVDQELYKDDKPGKIP